MTRKRRTKRVRQGEFVAEVDVELIDGDDGWSPYLSVEDAYKLDDVRDAFSRGGLDTACKKARIFRLIPVNQRTE